MYNILTIGGESSDPNRKRKDYDNQTYSCTRYWHPSASWGPNWVPPWNPSTITALWCWGFKGGPVMSKDANLSSSRCNFFQSGRKDAMYCKLRLFQLSKQSIRLKLKITNFSTFFVITWLLISYGRYIKLIWVQKFEIAAKLRNKLRA